MRKLETSEIRRQMKTISGWRKIGKQIRRSFTFKKFLEGIKFVGRVARQAERDFHHPDIDIRYTTITLTLTTHDFGGLTQRDFDLARKINRFYDK
jgi:4a-hydroxytetrahydrobiopterin dehydratase